MEDEALAADWPVEEIAGSDCSSGGGELRVSGWRCTAEGASGKGGWRVFSGPDTCAGAGAFSRRTLPGLTLGLAAETAGHPATSKKYPQCCRSPFASSKPDRRTDRNASELPYSHTCRKRRPSHGYYDDRGAEIVIRKLDISRN